MIIIPKSSLKVTPITLYGLLTRLDYNFFFLSLTNNFIMQIDTIQNEMLQFMKTDPIN